MTFSPQALQDHATLIGDRLLLTPLTVAAVSVEDYFAMIADPEGRRTTGTHASFDEAAARRYLESRPAQPDRADWAAIRIEDDAFLGEAVLNELDDDNESMNFRIALAGSHVYDRGYGTEITRLVVDFALDVVGLHRLELGVYDFNPRALRVYERCGFRIEGRRREALQWKGEWVDEIVMSILATDPRPLTPAVGAPTEGASRSRASPRPRPATHTTSRRPLTPG